MVFEAGAIVGGDFRVLHRLGQGGMGSVWAVEQISVGRKRALKVMRGEIAHDPKLRERFVQEAKIGATIESDHVVEVVAAGIDEARDLPWIAMELLDGRDLAAVITQRGALPLPEVAELARQLGHALAAAHAVGVVHRDLKPENVFLARSRRSDNAPFEVKVLDFGIAKIATEARTPITESAIIGTPLYMAPDQMDKSTPPTPAIDVWALGLIVYRAITGRYFWRSARDGSLSVATLMREILFDDVPRASVRAAEDGVADRLPSSGFDEWLARCLERDPDARFRDAGEACAELAVVLGATAERVSTATRNALVSGETPDALVTTPPSRPPKAAREARATTPSRLVAVHEDEDLAVARIGDVIVIDWRRTPSLASAERMDRAFARAIADLAGTPAVVMPVVRASNRAPDGEVRNAIARTVERQNLAVSRVAYVVLGSGFQSAALRAVITGLMLTARPTHTTKVFPSIADALAWVTAQSAAEAARRAPEPALADAIARFCGA